MTEYHTGRATAPRSGEDGNRGCSATLGAGAGASAPLSLAALFAMEKERWLTTVASYRLAGATYAVAMLLVTYINRKTGLAWPSMETIATSINRAESTVWRAIEELEDFQLLKVVREKDARGGRHKTNRYRLAFGAPDFDPSTLKRRT